MIQIKRSDLNDIAEEFAEYLNEWWQDKRRGRNNQHRYLEWAITEGNKENLGLQSMLEYYGDQINVIKDITSVKGLEEIKEDFEIRFRNEIRIWNGKTSQKEKGETQFGKFITKMRYAYTEFFKSDIKRKEDNKIINVGVWLSRRLNIITCPYCNRHYTFTIEKNSNHSQVRPQFDHFFPKSRYPILALCFYNLIPSCPECNKTKGEELIAIHPYEDSFDAQGMKFRIKFPYKGKEDFEIENGNGHPNVERLVLHDLYREHFDLVEELIQKASAYHCDYYDTLINSFNGLGLTESEMDRLIWGTSLETANMEYRPFSKLTRDILEQLGISSGYSKGGPSNISFLNP